jgi:hypothetical protein
METNVQTDKKGKKNKKFDSGEVTPPADNFGGEAAAAAEAGEAIEKAKGAARPRKWNYGFVPEATIVRVAENPTVRKDIEAAWAATATPGTTVDAFLNSFTDKSDARHGLRVMSRRGLIKVVHADGSEYPQKVDGSAVEAPAAEAAAETPAQ